MKAATSFSLNLLRALLIVIVSAAVAAAQTGSDTCAGLNATMGGTCTPLTNTTSSNNENTAYGAAALENDAGGEGGANTAVGAGALGSNTSGSSNTATGDGALFHNSSGALNTATGENALENSSGDSNTAIGTQALGLNFTGSENTGIGAFTQGGSSGSLNTSIGYEAGRDLTTGDNNIEIGNHGSSGDSNTIRIGAQGTQTETHIAGIFGSTGTKKACQVVIQSNARLGCMASSARYKHDIRDMSDASDKLMKLRPVIFKYKGDSDGIQQYGLIAEEVEKVYPELVVEGDDGKPESVEYQVLPAMLLNEVQKERRVDMRMARQLAQKDAQIAAMQRQLTALQKKNSEIDAMAERLDALERQARAPRPERMAATQ